VNIQSVTDRKEVNSPECVKALYKCVVGSKCVVLGDFLICFTFNLLKPSGNFTYDQA
jgi:hypothetical protein